VHEGHFPRPRCVASPHARSAHYPCSSLSLSLSLSLSVPPHPTPLPLINISNGRELSVGRVDSAVGRYRASASVIASPRTPRRNLASDRRDSVGRFLNRDTETRPAGRSARLIRARPHLLSKERVTGGWGRGRGCARQRRVMDER